MTDLGMMTGKAALRLAKEESGLTRDEDSGSALACHIQSPSVTSI